MAEAALPAAAAAAGSVLSKVPGGAAVVNAVAEATPGAVQFVQSPWVQGPVAFTVSYIAYEEGKATYYYAKAGDAQSAIEHGTNAIIVLAFAADSAGQAVKNMGPAIERLRGASRFVGGISAEEAAVLREKLLSIPGAEQVRVFGSRTKGTWTAKSDLDVVLLGDISKTSPDAISAIRDAQAYGLKIGIGLGKGGKVPLDVNIYMSVDEFIAAFLGNPDFNPALGVPRLLPLR